MLIGVLSSYFCRGAFGSPLIKSIGDRNPLRRGWRFAIVCRLPEDLEGNRKICVNLGTPYYNMIIHGKKYGEKFGEFSFYCYLCGQIY